MGGMFCLSRQDGFLVVNALVYINTHWTGQTMNHNVKLLSVIIHQTIILYKLYTLRGY